MLDHIVQVSSRKKRLVFPVNWRSTRTKEADISVYEWGRCIWKKIIEVKESFIEIERKVERMNLEKTKYLIVRSRRGQN